MNKISVPNILVLFAGCLVWASCSSTMKLSKEGFHPSTAKGKEIAQKVPDYSSELKTVKGKGRAIISEPNNTDRVTLLFSSNRKKSLVTIRNRLGIEGGKLLTDGDTLLVYNKVDEYARKIPIRGSKLEHINRLASLNILEMINYPLNNENIEQIQENNSHFRLSLSNGAQIFVNKESYLVEEVNQPKGTELPYSKILYGAYTDLNGFTLPRKITIFGVDKKSKIALQLTSLDLNTDIGPLTINLPDDIRIYHQ